MNQVKEILIKILNKIIQMLRARKNIAVRFVFCTLYAIINCALAFVLLVLAFVQFLQLFLTTCPSEAIRTLAHKLSVYNYRLLRYITLNENLKPWPLSSFPVEMEPAEDVDLSSPTDIPVNDTVPSQQTETASEDDVQEAEILDK